MGLLTVNAYRGGAQAPGSNIQDMLNNISEGVENHQRLQLDQEEADRKAKAQAVDMKMKKMKIAEASRVIDRRNVLNAMSDVENVARTDYDMSEEAMRSVNDKYNVLNNMTELSKEQYAKRLTDLNTLTSGTFDSFNTTSNNSARLTKEALKAHFDKSDLYSPEESRTLADKEVRARFGSTSAAGMESMSKQADRKLQARLQILGSSKDSGGSDVSGSTGDGTNTTTYSSDVSGTQKMISDMSIPEKASFTDKVLEGIGTPLTANKEEVRLVVNELSNMPGMDDSKVQRAVSIMVNKNRIFDDSYFQDMKPENLAKKLYTLVKDTGTRSTRDKVRTSGNFNGSGKSKDTLGKEAIKEYEEELRLINASGNPYGNRDMDLKKILGYDLSVKAPKGKKKVGKWELENEKLKEELENERKKWELERKLLNTADQRTEKDTDYFNEIHVKPKLSSEDRTEIIDIVTNSSGGKYLMQSFTDKGMTKAKVRAMLSNAKLPRLIKARIKDAFYEQEGFINPNPGVYEREISRLAEKDVAETGMSYNMKVIQERLRSGATGDFPQGQQGYRDNTTNQLNTGNSPFNVPISDIDRIRQQAADLRSNLVTDAGVLPAPKGSAKLDAEIGAKKSIIGQYIKSGTVPKSIERQLNKELMFAPNAQAEDAILAKYIKQYSKR